MNLITVGAFLLLLGLAPGALLMINMRDMRRDPQSCEESVAVPARGRTLRTLRPPVEGRYEFQIEVPTDETGGVFDAYVLHDVRTIEMYRQGQPLPYHRYSCAENVAAWRTSVEAGPEHEFALALINAGAQPLVVQVRHNFYVAPSALQGLRGSALIWAALGGLLGGVAGGILIAIGVIQHLF